MVGWYSKLCFHIHSLCRYAPEEFVKALTASGVYTDAEARKEFNRMDADDNKKIDIKQFTVWYVAMDDIGKRVRRNV